ncbi:cytochrome c-type biogenesis protein CcmH [Mesobacillus subterraneus]|uniref:cytochrome c-type biogenesis protein CcmH n=1 Tax=Mesobacillus subterraneus TaxID=285983 RepID=UPI00203E9725|nr:cytochrome c-type biogenesis protein CcmH [Mesobacillus subterraneus]MCM3665962.1 cytochrome c-type biogenesis protein CcmH [Mesobacillus subterraneus]MCM3684845.1 cytochrome c-type biogenesis protein CcmH [Mesobacillus subterraneus]
MKKKIILQTILFLILIPTLTTAFTYNSKEFKHIISQLDMQGHADHELSTCSVKKIYYDEVVEMLNGGKSENDIIQSYVDEYGQAALRTPGGGTSGWIAWGMPAAGFGIGSVIVGVWLRKLTLKKAETKMSAYKGWESEIEKEIASKTFDEERRKLF